MTILDRYIVRQFLVSFLFGLLTFVLIFVVIDMMEKLDDFIDANAPLETIIQYYVTFTPEMIKLMTPEGFAELMGTMWPELIDAMPFGMGPMMRFMGKVPGALNLMKPMFPVLFPRLLPMMMPKVMPVMLERVAAAVPIMPDYMREQMPELMPKVMDSLMPHMIGDLVPLVTQPMIDYLHGKTID